MPKKPITRQDRIREFNAEIYLSASFFKMSTLTGWKVPSLDARIVKESGSIVPLYNELAQQRYIPERETMPKYPQGRKK